MRKIIGIYKITNLVNGKIYIGQSINIYDRWNQHLIKAFNTKERAYNSIIHQAMRKYGKENFVLEILEECTQQELDDKEQYWIAALNSLTPNGYNISKGGQTNRLSKICTCEVCGCRISNGSKRCVEHLYISKNKPDPLELARIIKTLGGFEQAGRYFGISGQAIRKWCKTYNIPHTIKEVISWYEEQTGYDKPICKQPIYKKSVAQIDIDTNEIVATYESTNAAARALGKTKGNHISECCNGIGQTAYGYKWKYI